MLVLEIEDRGRGIPSASLNLIRSCEGDVGVGIASMTDRLQQLGGRLDIASGDRGTILVARLPLGKDAG
jgi:signal transduction histidine kinase